jgi:hypothetical protein
MVKRKYLKISDGEVPLKTDHSKYIRVAGNIVLN